MRVLLDTRVISEIRREQGRPRVRAQVEAIRNRDLFMSVITVGELTKGLTLLPAGRQQAALSE